jgi:hypothetical protein
VVVPVYDELTDTWSVSVANAYTYTPFGGFYEGQCVENIDNPFKFTSQWHDAEIDQYDLRWKNKISGQTIPAHQSLIS